MRFLNSSNNSFNGDSRLYFKYATEVKYNHNGELYA